MLDYDNLVLPWQSIADALGMPLADVRERETMAFERMDSEGMGAMLYGQMGATLTEGKKGIVWLIASDK